MSAVKFWLDSMGRAPPILGDDGAPATLITESPRTGKPAGRTRRWAVRRAWTAGTRGTFPRKRP